MKEKVLMSELTLNEKSEVLGGFIDPELYEREKWGLDAPPKDPFGIGNLKDVIIYW